MIQPTHQQMIDDLIQLCDKSSDVRFGQILAHLSFLAEDQGYPGLGEIDDADLLATMKQHLEDLSQRQQPVTE